MSELLLQGLHELKLKSGQESVVLSTAIPKPFAHEILDHNRIPPLLAFNFKFVLFQEQFVEYGGILRHSEKVLHIQPGSVVDIKTTKTCYKAKSVIITVGKGFLFCNDNNNNVIP